MAMPRTNFVLTAPRCGVLVRRLRHGALFALWAIAAAARAQTPDLTSMSLEELMEVQLQPLSATTSFQVSATAVDSCQVTASDLSFGTYDPLQPTGTDGTAVLAVTCTVDSGYTVGLDAGTGVGASVMERRLTGAEGVLRYGLYRDAGRALVWGDTPGSDTVGAVGTGVPVNHVVYGRIPPGQAVKRGMYVDVITVSVSY